MLATQLPHYTDCRQGVVIEGLLGDVGLENPVRNVIYGSRPFITLRVLIMPGVLTCLAWELSMKHPRLCCRCGSNPCVEEFRTFINI